MELGSWMAAVLALWLLAGSGMGACTCDPSPCPGSSTDLSIMLADPGAESIEELECDESLPQQQLPASLGGLVDLIRLDLRDAIFTGPFPDLTALTSLRSFFVGRWDGECIPGDVSSYIPAHMIDALHDVYYEDADEWEPPFNRRALGNYNDFTDFGELWSCPPEFTPIGGYCRTDGGKHGDFDLSCRKKFPGRCDEDECKSRCKADNLCVAIEYRDDTGYCELHHELPTSAVKSKVSKCMLYNDREPTPPADNFFETIGDGSCLDGGSPVSACTSARPCSRTQCTQLCAADKSCLAIQYRGDNGGACNKFSAVPTRTKKSAFIECLAYTKRGPSSYTFTDKGVNGGICRSNDDFDVVCDSTGNPGPCSWKSCQERCHDSPRCMAIEHTAAGTCELHYVKPVVVDVSDNVCHQYDFVTKGSFKKVGNGKCRTAADEAVDSELVCSSANGNPCSLKACSSKCGASRGCTSMQYRKSNKECRLAYSGEISNSKGDNKFACYNYVRNG